MTLGLYDSIWVTVDRLTKYTHLIQIKVNYNSEKLGRIYVKEVVRLHRAPVSIISDRYTQLTSKFWHKLHEELSINLNPSTTSLPQIDGQSKSTIQVLEDML